MLTAMVFAKDHEAVTSFYREGLGLMVDDSASEPGFTVLFGDRVRVAVHRIPDHVAAGIEIASPAEPRTAAAIKLIFAVPDIDDTTARLERLGGTALAEAGGDAVDVADPEGNVLRIEAI